MKTRMTARNEGANKKPVEPLRDSTGLSFSSMVGTAGFELATPCTPCKCATRLRYAPMTRIIGGAFGAPSGNEQAADREQFLSNLRRREGKERCERRFGVDVVHAGRVGDPSIVPRRQCGL